ncbi:MAG: NUDIX hydrolase [Rikenellaceae bacterium]
MKKSSYFGKQAVSVDCVVFGFDADNNTLKVALSKTEQSESSSQEEFKLLGSLIKNDEDIATAVMRVLNEKTGLKSLYIRQMAVFSEPDRVMGKGLDWINQRYGIDTCRVVTVAHYSLVKLSKSLLEHSAAAGVEWIDLNRVRKLALDHQRILVEAIDYLTRSFLQEPIAFEVLPRKFTIRQLKALYTTVLNTEIDDRNFRKKILASGLIDATSEKEIGVKHKPAKYYTFNGKRYQREHKRAKLNLINWQL